MKRAKDAIQEQQNTVVKTKLKESNIGGTAAIMDNRPEAIHQRNMKLAIDTSVSSNSIIQQKESLVKTNMVTSTPLSNQKGLPNNLKTGIENLSGFSMDDVKVHYNSNKPAQLQAHAYAQGTDIHLAPNQEKHLPHEAWHVVQQKQGRVKPTKQLKSKVSINDDAGLEKEADVMGEKAMNTTIQNQIPLQYKSIHTPLIQQKTKKDVTTYFEKLKNAPTSTLNLYTHVYSDGLGDAALIGHLYNTIEENKIHYGITNLNTFLAVERLTTEEELNAYENIGMDITKFREENDFINEKDTGYKNLVSSLSKATSNHIVWSVTSDSEQRDHAGGRKASQIPEGEWEIQYPVPIGETKSHNKLLKIQEMGDNNLDRITGAKTGEMDDGIGYGIPKLSGSINIEEHEIIRKASEFCNLYEAWMASVKGDKSGMVNPLPRIMATTLEKGGNDTLLYLPGYNLDENSTEYKAVKIVQKRSLILSKVTINGGDIYTLSGRFRNEFMQNRMDSIHEGVIFSGGEGMYTESLGTFNPNAVPIMAPRYDFQLLEIANAIIKNQVLNLDSEMLRMKIYPVPNALGRVVVSNSDTLYKYGIVMFGNMPHCYNHEEKLLVPIKYPNSGKKHVEEGDSFEGGFEVEIKYNEALTAMYLPLSLNTNNFSHVPPAYDFEVAKRVFKDEKHRLYQNNWLNIISEVSNNYNIPTKDNSHKPKRKKIFGLF